MNFHERVRCIDCKKCEKFRNRRLRPLTLEYLALAAVLRNNISTNDNQNEVKQNPEIFTNKLFRRKWKKWRYDIFHRMYSNRALHIIHWLSRTKEDRFTHDFQIATVKPFCNCQTVTCAEWCFYVCHDDVNSYKKRYHSHTTKCKMLF